MAKKTKNNDLEIKKPKYSDASFCSCVKFLKSNPFANILETNSKIVKITLKIFSYF